MILGNIAEVMTGPFGSALHQDEYVTEGVPVIMPQDIGNRTLSYDKIAYITPQKAKELARYIVIKDDIVYARRGDIEKHAFITENDQGSICGTGCLRVRVVTDKVNPSYLSFYLNKPETRKWIVTHAVGSNMPNINSDILSSTPLTLPDTVTQNRIAVVLETVEEKIKTNIEICSKLDSMTKLLYDYWFVQFDFPDENGKPYKSSGGKMVWNETLNRDIPEGWEVKPSLEVFDWVGTSQPPKSSFKYQPCEGYIRFIQNRDYDADDHITYIPITTGTRTCTEWDIMIDKYGDAGKTRFGIAGAYNVALSKIVVHNVAMREYVRAYLKSDIIYNYLYNACKASTRASLNEANFNFLSIAIPDANTLYKYDALAKEMIAKQLDVKAENQQLIALRDFLLPMLMNGQVTVEKAIKGDSHAS